MRGLVWFREDLRVNDNHALYYAAENCKDGVIGVFVLDPKMWLQHNVAACRVEFILRGLKELNNELQLLNIPLLIISVNDISETPQELFKKIKSLKAQALFYNRQYEINELQRDQSVQHYLKAQSIYCYSYDDQVILPPTSLVTKQGSYFKKFTPYKNTWREALNELGGISLLSRPKVQAALEIKSSKIPSAIPGFTSHIAVDLWSAGEKNAQIRLQHFVDNHLQFYASQRDFPAVDGTSKLSPYLATGMISARQCFKAALENNHNQLTTGKTGHLTWMSEIIWREFYKSLLLTSPRIVMGKPFQLITDKLQWNYNKSLLTAWQEGRTGFPIIDAAMNQLNTTGWMHNRLRMLVAMFLAKNLFLDWRLGEKYFMQHLIDGDFSANNGGWQWSAGTGVDAVPYFRVFNPVRQSEKFDPEGKFIRKFCPELNALNSKEIHDPSNRAATWLANTHYPQAIVNLNESRQAFITAFKQLKAGFNS